jgi:flagellar L-ring protein precursor FlgH
MATLIQPLSLMAQAPPPGVFVEPRGTYPAPPLPPGPQNGYPQPQFPQNPYPQNQFLYPPPGPPAPPGVFLDDPHAYAIRDYSWHYIAAPQPRQIREQDLITILVREISEVSVDSRFDRQRRSTLLAELREFIRIGETRNLENAADNEPTIDANLSGRLNSNGRVNEKEEVTYRIAATVVDVLPNGNLVLEAQKEIQTNDEIWRYTLTGTIRSQDINRDNTALSENIANLQIKKSQSGKVYDSTKRPWGTRLYDLLFPF